MLLGIMDSVVPGCSLFAGCEILRGLPEGKPVEIEVPRTHEFDEVIGFGGTNPDYPREHCPVTIKRIDTPIFMFEAANDPEYRKVL